MSSQDDKLGPALDAIALVEAHLRDDDEAFDALITASADPEYLRRVIVRLADMVMGEVRDHHGPYAQAMLDDYRQFVLSP